MGWELLSSTNWTSDWRRGSFANASSAPFWAPTLSLPVRPCLHIVWFKRTQGNLDVDFFGCPTSSKKIPPTKSHETSQWNQPPCLNLVAFFLRCWDFPILNHHLPLSIYLFRSVVLSCGAVDASKSPTKSGEIHRSHLKTLVQKETPCCFAM